MDGYNEQYRIALLSPDGIVQSDGSCGEGSESRRASWQWNRTSKVIGHHLQISTYGENLSNLI